MDRPPAEESLWLPRQSLASTSDKTLQTKVGGREPADGWIVRYVTWVLESREVWRLFLLPFLLLLFLLQSSEEELTVPENTYTLF